MKQIPLFGTGIAGKSFVVTDQRRLNCYYELREDSDKVKIALYGTPGTTLFVNMGTAPVRGLYVIGNVLYAVQGSGLYSISTVGVTTLLGSLSTNTGLVSMADNGTQLMIVDGAAGYILTLATSAFAAIASANFPNGASSVAFLDGFFIVNKPNTGQFWKSSQYDGTAWSGTDFATAESNPDNLVALDSDHGFAVLWGTLSIEFWQNLGTAGFPFAPIRAAAQQWGLAAQYSRVKFNNSMAFLAQNLQGQVQVMMLNGFVPQRISTHDIENIINGFTVKSDAIAMAYMLDGHPMYQITFQSAARSFLFDGSTNIWSEVQTGTALQARHVANLCVAFNGSNYVSDYSNGNIYKLDPNAYTDNGTAITRLLQSRHLNQDGNMFGIDELFLDLETGIGLQSGQGSNPQMMMQVSKDGGRTFGPERWTSMGLVGQYIGPRVTWRRMGVSRDFVFRFKLTDPVKLAVTYGAAVVRGEGQ